MSSKLDKVLFWPFGAFFNGCLDQSFYFEIDTPVFVSARKSNLGSPASPTYITLTHYLNMDKRKRKRKKEKRKKTIM